MRTRECPAPANDNEQTLEDVINYLTAKNLNELNRTLLACCSESYSTGLFFVAIAQSSITETISIIKPLVSS